ncbi:MAG: hypothetical protein HFJ58_02350 [Clostridia bacterium]|nr:hypothetical protein [Clostridia bacterium]
MINKQIKLPLTDEELSPIKNNGVLCPTIDVVFKALFGEVGSEKITSRFLESILERKIETLDLSRFSRS